MPASSYTCLYSTVVNTSGATQYFGFLGPHGVNLANAEEFSDIGHVTEWLPKGLLGWKTSRKRALEAALEENKVEIKSTPVVILFDTTAAKSFTIESKNSKLYLSDPCWVDSPAADILVGPP